MHKIINMLISVFREIVLGRAALHTEILALRQQVAVLKRKRPRPSLRKADRGFWVILSYLWPGWRHALVIVRPETVIGWHRKGFRLSWDMEVAAGKARPTARVEGDPRSGPTDVSGEYVVGCASDSWGAFEAWLFPSPRPPSLNTWSITPRRPRRRGGIVKLTGCRLFSAFLHEANPLKLLRAAIDNLPRFRS